jgi:hypothetical protein
MKKTAYQNKHMEDIVHIPFLLAYAIEYSSDSISHSPSKEQNKSWQSECSDSGRADQ